MGINKEVLISITAHLETVNTQIKEVLFSHKEEWNYAICRKWMEMEVILLSKISQTHKDRCHIFSHMWNIDF
jgi:hypothetical protein